VGINRARGRYKIIDYHVVRNFRGTERPVGGEKDSACQRFFTVAAQEVEDDRFYFAGQSG